MREPRRVLIRLRGVQPRGSTARTPVWRNSSGPDQLAPNLRRSASLCPDARRWRRLGPEPAAAAVLMRAVTFLGYHRLHGRARDVSFEPARLCIEALERGQFIAVPEPRFHDRGLHHRDRPIIDLQWHRI